MSGPLDEARRVFRIEAQWLARTLDLCEEAFPQAVELLGGIRGRVVVTGMGKSGHVARKIAATMTSTGTPAFFLHPAEALHGDLGAVSPSDAALVLSKSGDTPEIAALLPCFRRMGVPVVAMVSRADSALGRSADIVLPLPDMQEACPHNLAPTASTTAMLVLGDALAMALLEARDFSPEDFAHVHPGGIIGRKLLTRVSDLMTGPPLPVAGPDAPLHEVIDVMTGHRGVCMTVDGQGRLDGIFVYGDLGRLMRDRGDIATLTLAEVVRRDPAVTRPDETASAALARMEARGITSLVVVDQDGRPVGVAYLHDIMRAGIY